VPASEGWLAWLPAPEMFCILLIADDLTQYGWHRLSHTSWLYPLHRAHHSARYLSVRVVYRNHFLYYLFMPGIWASAVLVYWGFGEVYAVYLIAKMAVIIGAHSSVPWDAPLYDRFPRLMWVVERTISTPATHSAHHGLHESDGITHYKGNYGNFLFFWDVLFGTARISRKRPAAYGIEHLAPVRLVDELVWYSAARVLPDDSPESGRSS
jgi:sterol desaturase/sphingolipid hydroxylase (fatty acid hydroxylase superfamily)